MLTSGGNRPLQGGSPGAAASPATPGVPIEVTVSTVSGSSFTVQVTSKDSVAVLKERLRAVCGIAKFQQKLLLQEQVLQDSWILEDHGVVDGAQLTVIVGPPVPDWASQLGLDGDHPARLRNYLSDHDLTRPDWIDSDEDVWKQLKDAMEVNSRNRSELRGWNSSVLLSHNGQPSAVLRASPGSRVEVRVSGWIQNNQGDSCIHQVLLACDLEIVAELYDGVPNRGREMTKTVRIQAPRQRGAYMLWRSGHLEYGMRDARRNFTGSNPNLKPDVYPTKFVGWMIVE
eukprot:TRINITY_DN72484_c0_g1_i1.p1 TRINITY_DN72484_c0_g1~~TRINITY_DN72484_c0_g1_i1.p1  ORF type:complete len:293 (-),score=47.59 TRINITY_DN72484_c0_g1_i1:210-1067(-)